MKNKKKDDINYIKTSISEITWAITFSKKINKKMTCLIFF